MRLLNIIYGDVTSTRYPNFFIEMPDSSIKIKHAVKCLSDYTFLVPIDNENSIAIETNIKCRFILKQSFMIRARVFYYVRITNDTKYTLIPNTPKKSSPIFKLSRKKSTKSNTVKPLDISDINTVKVVHVDDIQQSMKSTTMRDSIGNDSSSTIMTDPAYIPLLLERARVAEKRHVALTPGLTNNVSVKMLIAMLVVIGGVLGLVAFVTTGGADGAFSLDDIVNLPGPFYGSG